MRQGLVLPTKVVIKETKTEGQKTTAGGIIVPETKRKITDSGEIILVGSKCETAKVGLIALYPPLSAVRFEIDDEEYSLVAESSIIFMYEK